MYYQFATVALNICSVRSFTICVTSSSCTDARLCVVSYDLLAVNCRSKSSLWLALFVKRTFTVIDSSVWADHPSAATDLLRCEYCVISPSIFRSPFRFTWLSFVWLANMSLS